MDKPKKKRGRPAGKLQQRLLPTEQVRDDISDSYGFSAGAATYEPLSQLTPAQIRDYIIACGWVDDCVKTITEEVVKYPLVTSPKNEVIDAFLKYPSETDPLFIIRKKVIKDMLRYGNGAAIIAYKAGKPHALLPTPGYALRVTDHNPPKYKLRDIKSNSFKKDKAGKDIILENKEVMHFQIDGDSDSTMARSPLERVYDLITSDKNISKALAEFTSRGFFKPSFISIEGGSKKEIGDYVEFLNQMVIDGAKVFGLNKKATVHDLPYWSASEIIDTQKWIGLRVANAFKVPPIMLNLVADVGSLSAREQRGRFLENVVLPILVYEGYLYTMNLARLGFKDTETEIHAPTMQLKLNYNTVRSAAMLIPRDESLLTVDEAREHVLGLPPKTK